MSRSAHFYLPSAIRLLRFAVPSTFLMLFPPPFLPVFASFPSVPPLRPSLFSLLSSLPFSICFVSLRCCASVATPPSRGRPARRLSLIALLSPSARPSLLGVRLYILLSCFLFLFDFLSLFFAFFPRALPAQPNTLVHPFLPLRHFLLSFTNRRLSNSSLTLQLAPPPAHPSPAAFLYRQV